MYNEFKLVVFHLPLLVQKVGLVILEYLLAQLADRFPPCRLFRLGQLEFFLFFLRYFGESQIVFHLDAAHREEDALDHHGFGEDRVELFTPLSIVFPLFPRDFYFLLPKTVKALNAKYLRLWLVQLLYDQNKCTQRCNDIYSAVKELGKG